jgi:hypothetical protein
MATVVSLVAATWCSSADLHSPRTCVYSRAQCEEIVRLRRTGVCTPHRNFGRCNGIKSGRSRAGATHIIVHVLLLRACCEFAQRVC